MKAMALTKSALLCLAVTACILMVSCRVSPNAGVAADPADLLPIDNDISGFLKKGSTSVMTDQQSIFSAIDGEAQRYIDYGFMEGVKQLYSNGSVDIDIQLFNQGDATNAQNLFERFYPTSPELISPKNPIVVIEHSLSNGYQILYTKQSILLRITTTEKSDFALNMAKQFYWNIDKKIGNGE
jgi:hypothetical protein